MEKNQLKPARVFEQFAKINAIPRPSKHEALRLVATISKPQNRCLILGEMRELGDTSDECHRTLGREAGPALRNLWTR